MSYLWIFSGRILYYYNNSNSSWSNKHKQSSVQFSSVHISFDFIELVVIDFYLIFLANLNANLLFSSLCICIIFRKCFILVFAFFGSSYTFDCCYVIFGYICLLNYDTDRIHIWNERKWKQNLIIMSEWMADLQTNQPTDRPTKIIKHKCYKCA